MAALNSRYGWPLLLSLWLGLETVFAQTGHQTTACWNAGAEFGHAEPIPNPKPLDLIQLPADSDLGLDYQIWGEQGFQKDWLKLVMAVDRSLAYLQTPKAVTDYENYPIPEITRDRVEQSLQHFRKLLFTATSPLDLQRRVQADFVFYQATGTPEAPNQVDFTGYFEPTYQARSRPDATYRYPLYKRPSDLESWPQPHPTRLALEGADALQAAQGPLKGLELVWLRDRLEAYLIQVQGSARVNLVDQQNRPFTVGYDGRTEYPYVSIGRELVEDGVFSLEELTLPKVLQYFEENPEALNEYLPRNQRFIFFRATDGAPPTGSLSVPVTADRSLATDKSLMPPGALTLAVLSLPYLDQQNRLEMQAVNRYMLDQDTGGAIKGAGRADIFMGNGRNAERRAGAVNTPGQLYYLLLRPCSTPGASG